MLGIWCSTVLLHKNFSGLNPTFKQLTCLRIKHFKKLIPIFILQVDLRDKGALETVFASTRWSYHICSACSIVLTLFHLHIIMNSSSFCKFVPIIFFIVRQFVIQIWCCCPLRWTESCGWKCAEAIALLWQQCHWDD